MRFRSDLGFPLRPSPEVLVKGGFDLLESRPPRVGVLGAARIVPRALVDAAQGLIELRSVAARQVARAARFAQTHGFFDHAESYEEILERSDIDVVYVALPVALHAPWVDRALRAGKHVLCEKPFSLRAAQARQSVELSAGCRRLLMEAHHSRYHPLVTEMMKELARLGPIETIELSFHGSIPPGDIRLEPTLGAGVLLDFGCYLVEWNRLLTGDPSPEIRSARAVEAAPGIDVAASIELRSRSGIRSRLDCDMRPERAFHASISIQAQRGQLYFNNPLSTEGSFLSVKRGSVEVRKPAPAAPSTYRAQLQQLVHSLTTGEVPPTSGRALLDTQELLDALVFACGLPARDDLARR